MGTIFFDPVMIKILFIWQKSVRSVIPRALETRVSAKIKIQFVWQIGVDFCGLQSDEWTAPKRPNATETLKYKAQRGKEKNEQTTVKGQSNPEPGRGGCLLQLQPEEAVPAFSEAKPSFYNVLREAETDKEGRIRGVPAEMPQAEGRA